MKSSIGIIRAMVRLVAMGAGLVLVPTLLVAAKALTHTPAPVHVKPQLMEAYGKLPLSFEANQGQTDSQVKFLSRGSGYTLFLTPSEAVVALRGRENVNREEGKGKSTSPRPTEGEGQGEGATLRMHFEGANRDAKITGLEKLPGIVNYFVGKDPAKWRTNVPTYARVRYQEIYPGIDLVYYGNQRQLEYDLIVAPGADPDRVQLSFHGADGIKLDGQGNLILAASGGELHLLKPHVYQVADGKKVEIAAKYVLLASGAESSTHALSISHQPSAIR